MRILTVATLCLAAAVIWPTITSAATIDVVQVSGNPGGPGGIVLLNVQVTGDVGFDIASDYTFDLSLTGNAEFASQDETRTTSDSDWIFDSVAPPPTPTFTFTTSTATDLVGDGDGDSINPTDITGATFLLGQIAVRATGAARNGDTFDVVIDSVGGSFDATDIGSNATVTVNPEPAHYLALGLLGAVVWTRRKRKGREKDAVVLDGGTVAVEA